MNDTKTVLVSKLRLHALMTMTTGFDENGTEMIWANVVEHEVAAFWADNGHSLTYTPCSEGNICYTTTPPCCLLRQSKDFHSEGQNENQHFCNSAAYAHSFVFI